MIEKLFAQQKEIYRQIKECVRCALNYEFATLGQRADAIKQKAKLERERLAIREKIRNLQKSI